MERWTGDLIYSDICRTCNGIEAVPQEAAGNLALGAAAYAQDLCFWQKGACH